MKLNELRKLGSSDKKALSALWKALKRKNINYGAAGQSIIIQLDNKRAVKLRVVSAEITSMETKTGDSSEIPADYGGTKDYENPNDKTNWS